MDTLDLLVGEVGAPELPKWVIIGGPASEAPQRHRPWGEALSGYIDEVLAPCLYPASQYVPVTLPGPAMLDLRMDRPEFGVYGMSSLNNVMIGYQVDHRQCFVPRLPVDGGTEPDSVRRWGDLLHVQPGELDGHVGLAAWSGRRRWW